MACRSTRALYFDLRDSDPQDSSSGYKYSQLLISMHVRRRSTYWLNNIMLPTFIITGSLLASYSLPRDDGTRLEVSITVLLALVTFKTVLVEKLPDIGYATLIDHYVLSAFIFAFGIILAQYDERHACPPAHRRRSDTLASSSASASVGHHKHMRSARCPSASRRGVTGGGGGTTLSDSVRVPPRALVSLILSSGRSHTWKSTMRTTTA